MYALEVELLTASGRAAWCQFVQAVQLVGVAWRASCLRSGNVSLPESRSHTVGGCRSGYWNIFRPHHTSHWSQPV
jgi:hypothetical protein